jgi:VanZ family protein
MPSRLAIWTNEYGNLRTAVPFIFLGFSLNAMFNYKNSTEIILSKAMIFKLFIKITFICSLLVFIVELGQFFLPKRSPDIEDILWGIVGTQIGFALYLSLIKFQCYYTNHAK